MTYIERYIMGEILKPLTAVSGILVGLFVSFSGARYLAEAVTETMGVEGIAKLVMLKTVIALEVLIPIGLYIAIVIGLGRLHRDQEITALRASGVSGNRVVNAVVLLAIPFGVVVGALSMIGRPWAYELSYVLDARAQAEFNPDRVQAGRFHGSEESGRVFYVQGKSSSGGRMERVLVFRRHDQASEIIIARSAERLQRDPDQRAQLHLYDGMLYRLIRAGASDTSVRFEKLVIFLKEPAESIGYKRKAASTSSLLHSDLPPEVAELQWRLSRPIATILLALVAVPLSRASPREGRHERTVVAMLVFAVYYNLSGLAQTWVEQGIVGSIPGVWWLHALMLLAVIAFLGPEYRKTLARRT